MRKLNNGTYKIERNDQHIPCPNCGGFCERVECTDAERKEYGCGRRYDCCSAAFVCIKCGNRVAVSLPAPEME